MARRNKHAGRCPLCDRRVEVGEGFIERFKGRWSVRCQKCVGKGHKSA